MSNTDRRIAEITSGAGFFTRQQAYEAGISARQLRIRMRNGLLEPAGPNAFRSPLAPRSLLADLRALLADVGEPCWASGPTAAALHGLDGFSLRRPLHVTVLRGRHVERTGVRVHTSIELPRIDQAVVGGLRVTSAARTLIELARTLDVRRLTTALDAGLRDGRYSEALLHGRIVALRGKGRYGIPALLDVIAGLDVTRGGHSWLEREYLRITAAAGLPRPETQQVLSRAGDKLIRVDFRYPGTNVVVEVLGYRFHRSTDQLTRDTERMSALVLDGFAPFQFTYQHLVSSPARVVDTVRGALTAFTVTTKARSRRLS